MSAHSSSAHSSSADVRLPAALDRLRMPSLAVGAGLLVVGLILAFTVGNGIDSFMQGYLYAFVIVGGIAIGSIALLCIHHMTRGSWSYIIQRILEANTRTLWIVALAFVPILVGPLTTSSFHSLYSRWTHPSGEFAEVVLNKTALLNPATWATVSVALFLIWLAIAYLLNKWSRDLDETGNALICVKFRRFSPPALIVYALTMTVAGVLWLQSLTPEWFSTMYGPLQWISQGLTILAFSILVLSYLQDEKPLSRCVQADHYHRLGNLMMAFTVLWAYMSFSQYLIIWSGNLPEEISYYYTYRNTQGFHILAVILMFGHFFFPLMWLLFRRNKLNLRPLRFICCWILTMRMFDVFWNVNPSFPHAVPGVYFSEVLTSVIILLGFSGVWFWFFLGELAKRPLLALNDPAFYDAVQYPEHHGPQHHGEALDHA